MKRILGLVVALILYGSFYPWRFHGANLPHNPLWILAHSWPPAFGRADARDAAINMALYIPFGAFLFLSLFGVRTFARVVLTIAASVCLSGSIEMIQLFDAGRNCSLFDVLCNTIGGTIGIGLATQFPGLISSAIREVELAGAFRASGSIALLYLSLGYHIFPLIPAISSSPLQLKFRAFVNSGTWMLRDFFEAGGAWLAVAALLNRLAPRNFGAALLLALGAIPLKFLILGRTATPPEMAGAMVGIAAWLVLRNRKSPMLAAAAISLATLLAAGLLPYRLVAPQPFLWTPFLALLSSPWESAFVILLKKSFLYGSAVWLLNENGRGWIQSTAIVTVLLAAIEATQVYLPGRTAEITDPVLALMIGLVLMMLERQSRENAKSPGI